MANNLTIFKNSSFGEVRTTIINGEPYFIGKEVATILGYKDTAKAIKAHVDKEDFMVGDLSTIKGTRVENKEGKTTLVIRQPDLTYKKQIYQA
jgi:prophage antirepressor-like protein